MSIPPVNSGTPQLVLGSISKQTNPITQTAVSQLGELRQGFLPCLCIAALVKCCQLMKGIGCTGECAKGCKVCCPESSNPPAPNANNGVAAVAAATATAAVIITLPQRPQMKRDEDPPSTTENSLVASSPIEVSVEADHTAPENAQPPTAPQNAQPPTNVQQMAEQHVEQTRSFSSASEPPVPVVTSQKRPPSNSVSNRIKNWEALRNNQ